jgi:TRAP-type C4-dicarboxylate transport system permease small subunit
MARVVERWLGWIAGASLFGMMALTFADVLGRKLLDRSIPGSLEVTELLMFGVIFAGLPLTSLKGEHVVFDLLDRLLPDAPRRLLSTVSNLTSSALLVGAGWLVVVRALRTHDQGDTTAQLQIALAPWQIAAGAMIALAAVMHLVLAFRDVADADGDDPAAGAL